MNSLVNRKDSQEINRAFYYVQSLAGDTSTIWQIYLRSLASVLSLGDSFAMSKAAEAFKLFPQNDIIFQLYRIMTYGQERVGKAQQLYQNANKLYNERNFDEAFNLFNQAFDLDPLEFSYALNSGLSLYENAKYEEAISYFKIAQNSKKTAVKEKAMRYKGISLYKNGSQSESCATFLKLVNTYPKRMYRQEFNKYCKN